MTLSVVELARVREEVAQLLDELRLDAYLFEVEPQNAHWEVKIECAVTEGWETFRLTAEKQNLLRARDNIETHKQLLNDWRSALTACRVKT